MRLHIVVTTVAALALMAGAATASASTGRAGDLHITKECSQYTGQPGGFCTITDSNVRQIKPSAKIFYDQAPGIPAGLLDSNIVLDAGGGNRAVGRCTLDLSTFHGLCTLSDGTGDLAGFSARVDVVCAAPQGTPCTWDGTYRFHSER